MADNKAPEVKPDASATEEETAKAMKAVHDQKKAAETAPAVKAADLKPGKYFAVNQDMRNPFTEQVFKMGKPVEAEKLDNWLAAQCRAGWVKFHETK